MNSKIKEYFSEIELRILEKPIFREPAPPPKRIHGMTTGAGNMILDRFSF